MDDIFIHSTANVSNQAKIGKNTMIWQNAQIREDAEIGTDNIIAKDVYIAEYVKIGNRCKIQNGVSIFTGVTLENDIFVGPNACFTNDRVPRAFNKDWKIIPTLIKNGASIGANATIVCGVVIGEYAMVAAGSVVIKDVEAYSLVMGNPAKHYCYIDKMGNKINYNPLEENR